MHEPYLCASEISDALFQLIPTNINVARPCSQDIKLHHAQTQLHKELTKVLNVITPLLPKSTNAYRHLLWATRYINLRLGHTHNAPTKY